MLSSLSDLARAWAKTLAYLNCGKRADADQWARLLVAMLQAEGLLSDVEVRS